jgi:hypothetical protein
LAAAAQSAAAAAAAARAQEQQPAAPVQPPLAPAAAAAAAAGSVNSKQQDVESEARRLELEIAKLLATVSHSKPQSPPQNQEQPGNR